MLLCAPVLLDRRARGRRDHERGHRRAEGRAAARHRVGRDHRHARVHRAERQVGRVGHRDGGEGFGRQLHARRHEDVRDRRPHREPRRGRGARSRARAARTASRFFAVDGDAAGLTRTPLATMDQTRKQARLDFDGVAATSARRAPAPVGRRCRRRSTRPRSAIANEMRRRRAEGARDVGRVREGARAVRPPDRVVPGDQAQVRRHAARGRVGQVGRVLRRVGGRRGQRRAAGGRRASPRPTAPTRTSTPPPRTSRSTAASASPGSTTRTCTSSARRAPRSCSATPRTTASCSRSASASDALPRSVTAATSPRRPRRTFGNVQLRWPSSSCSSVSCSRCWRCSWPGLLRSHAEILRALHQLGVDLDPRARPTRRRGVSRPSASVRSPVVRLGRGAEAARARRAVDVVGTTPDARRGQHRGRRAPTHLTLLAFLSSGCGTCHRVLGRVRATAAGRGPRRRAPRVRQQGRAARRASPASAGSRPTGIPIVMSSDGMGRYDVPVAPFFVLIDGESGDVIGEGAASNWEQVQSLLHTALDDAGHARPQGQRQGGSRPASRAPTRLREARADRDLLAAGIGPGDPSLYTLPSTDLPDAGSRVAMTDLAAHGIEVTLADRLGRPRVPSPGRGRDRRAGADDGPPAPPGETTNAVVHVSTIALPPGVGDFASGAVDRLGPTTRSSCSSSTTPRAPTSRCSRAEGIPQALERRRLQPGRAPAHDPRAGRRAAVLPRSGPRVLPLRGAGRVRQPAAEWCPEVNEVLATLTIDQLGGDRHDPEHDHRAVDDRRRRRRTDARHPPTTDATHRPTVPSAADSVRRHPERPVSVLAGPFAIAAVLLAVGGALKAVRPRDTAHALSAVGLRFPACFPRPYRGARRRRGRSGHRRRRAARRRSRASPRSSRCRTSRSPVFVAVALRSGAPISSCGCFGKVDTPPSVVHVVHRRRRRRWSRRWPRCRRRLSRCPTCSPTSRCSASRSCSSSRSDARSCSSRSPRSRRRWPRSGRSAA